MKKRLVISSFLTLTLFASVCSADSAYKWTDEQGRVFFGSKPPKNASGITAVKANNFSRYKPSASLTRLRNTEARARLSHVREADLPLPPPPKDSFDVKGDAPTSQTQLELTPESPVVKVGKQQEIESCTVMVNNKTPIDVDGVQVSFEFSDGTLVSAAGPERLNNGQGALYSVSLQQLPLKLQAGTSTTPKVIVNTDAETVVKPVAETN